MRCETHPLQPYLDRGLAAGLHGPSSTHPEKCCLLEAVTLARGKPKSDNPAEAGLPDWRALNDAGWSSESVRAVHMGELALAYWDWAEWTEERQLAVVSRAVILTVQRVISALPGLTDAVRGQCRAAETLSEARAAAYAAEAAAYAASLSEARAAYAAAAAAAYAAADRDSVLVTGAAAYAAARAARAAADRDSVLVTACGCWHSALED